MIEETTKGLDGMKTYIMDAIDAHMDWACKYNKGRVSSDELSETILQIMQDENTYRCPCCNGTGRIPSKPLFIIQEQQESNTLEERDVVRI